MFFFVNFNQAGTSGRSYSGSLTQTLKSGKDICELSLNWSQGGAAKSVVRGVRLFWVTVTSKAIVGNVVAAVGLQGHVVLQDVSDIRYISRQ